MKTQFSFLQPVSTRPRAGFTLVEMLAVIAVIATLMTVGIVGMKSASSGKGSTAGLAIVDSLIEEARTVAKNRGTRTRLLIHSEYTPLSNRKTASGALEGKRYLRYMAVAYEELDEDTNEPTGEWTIGSRGISLPQDTYFHPEHSQRDGVTLMKYSAEDMPGSISAISCYYFEFNSQGRLVSPTLSGNSTARFIVAGGVLREGGEADPLPQPRRARERDFAGVVIWPTGRTSIIRDANEIDGGGGAL